MATTKKRLHCWLRLRPHTFSAFEDRGTETYATCDVCGARCHVGTTRSGPM